MSEIDIKKKTVSEYGFFISQLFRIAIWVEILSTHIQMLRCVWWLLFFSPTFCEQKMPTFMLPKSEERKKGQI